MNKTGCFVLLLAFLALALVVVPQGVRVSSSSWVVSHPTVVNLHAYPITGKPTISAAFIGKVLRAYGSPASGSAQALYADGVQFGIDPVYALAFFLHEDRFGTTGWGAVNHSLGNTRCSAGYQCRGGYRSYPTWQAGFLDWYHLLKVLYITQWHLVTVDQIIPVYAPSSDGNNVAGYITAIKTAVDTWRSGTVEVA